VSGRRNLLTLTVLLPNGTGCNGRQSNSIRETCWDFHGIEKILDVSGRDIKVLVGRGFNGTDRGSGRGSSRRRVNIVEVNDSGIEHDSNGPIFLFDKEFP